MKPTAEGPISSALEAQLVGIWPVLKAVSDSDQVWLRAIRLKLGRSQVEVAAELGMTRQAYADLESAEARGAISMNSLRRAAKALDCDLVHVLVPQMRPPATVEPVPRQNDSESVKPRRKTKANNQDVTPPQPEIVVDLFSRAEFGG